MIYLWDIRQFTNAGENLQKWRLNILGLEQPKFKPLKLKTSNSREIENESLNDELGSQRL